VVGGGRAFVEAELRAARLEAELASLDERAPDELAQALVEAERAGRPVIVVAGGPPVVPHAPEALQVLAADLRHPEALRALFAALASPPTELAGRALPRPADKALAERVRGEVDTTLSDHDAKRLLKAWGVKVTRQAPTSTPTGAVKLARQIGLPVALVAGDDARTADSLPQVRQIAALMLHAVDGAAPSVMVRERFPEAPRTHARVVAEKGLGLTMRVGEACALVPLSPSDAQALAAATPARRAAVERAVAELLGRIAACAAAENALFDLELYVGPEPAVVSARGELRRSPA
jgi:hypothetical protein